MKAIRAPLSLNGGTITRASSSSKPAVTLYSKGNEQYCAVCSRGVCLEREKNSSKVEKWNDGICFGNAIKLLSSGREKKSSRLSGLKEGRGNINIQGILDLVQ